MQIPIYNLRTQLPKSTFPQSSHSHYSHGYHKYPSQNHIPQSPNPPNHHRDLLSHHHRPQPNPNLALFPSQPLFCTATTATSALLLRLPPTSPLLHYAMPPSPAPNLQSPPASTQSQSTMNLIHHHHHCHSSRCAATTRALLRSISSKPTPHPGVAPPGHRRYKAVFDEPRPEPVLVSNPS